MEDKLAIRELIDNWAVWRDSFQWDRFRTVWHPEGRMWATWFQGTYEEFIEANRQGYAKGVRIYHFLGGSSIDIKGKRAIAQTKMSISQRAPLEGVRMRRALHRPVLRFSGKAQGQVGPGVAPPDLREGPDRSGRSGARRPSSIPKLLARFPVGYRHLAYLQTKVGYKVKDDMPGVDGPATDALYALGANWLKGVSVKKIGW